MEHLVRSSAALDTSSGVAMSNECGTLTVETKHPQLMRVYVRYQSEISAAALEYAVPAAVIVAVIDRESAGKNVVGDGGHGFGLMQIDNRFHPRFLDSNSGGLEPASNIRYGAKLLRENFDRFGRWDAALAAYNAGQARVADAIMAGRPVDSVTTGKNYSQDVLLRANRFESALDVSAKNGCRQS